MAKIRLKKKKIRYATVSRKLLSNPKISLRAKGLGAWLELHQDGFELNFEFILQNMKEGRDTLRKVLKELREENFLITVQTRNESGKFETIWVFDSEGAVSRDVLPTTEMPEAVIPEAVPPEAVKPTQIIKQNKRKDKKENTHTETESDPLFEQWLDEYCSSANNPPAYKAMMRKKFREGNEDAQKAYQVWRSAYLEKHQKEEYEKRINSYDYTQLAGMKLGEKTIIRVVDTGSNLHLFFDDGTDDYNYVKRDIYQWIQQKYKEAV